MKIAVVFYAAYFFHVSEMIPNNPLLKIMDTSSWNWVQFALSLVFLCYLMFFCTDKSVITWNLNMFTLIGIGSGCFYSACLAYFSQNFSK
jgi:Cu2+-exporting ATPase